MNTQQIKSFLVAAQCGSFTQAAELLYVTQPALSRQIAALEAELGYKLFVRTNRSVQLTAAGESLARELSTIYTGLEDAVERARNAYMGITDKLFIGVLGGMVVGDFLPQAISLLRESFRFIDVEPRSLSFSELLTGIYDGSLDLALTLRFDIEGCQGIEYKTLLEGREYIAIHKSNPLLEYVGDDFIKLKQIGDAPFIMVDENDSKHSSRLIIDGCRKQGYQPNVKYSPSIHDSMVWLQADLGVAMLDSRNMLSASPDIVFLETNSVCNPSVIAIWKKGNSDPAIPLFVELIAGTLKQAERNAQAKKDADYGEGEDE